jgi:hypothetical protein
MTQTIFEGINISSQFTRIGRRLSNDGYKKTFHMLFPKYSILINNETFEYSQSARYLAEGLGIKNSCVYNNTSPGAIVNEIYLDSGNYTRTTANNLYPRIFSNRRTTISDVNNKFLQSKASKLSEKDILFAFRCILEDALVGFNYFTPGEFGKEFGYEDIDECIKVFNACNQTRVKLRFSETRINQLIDKLSEQGIE